MDINLNVFVILKKQKYNMLIVILRHASMFMGNRIVGSNPTPGTKKII